MKKLFIFAVVAATLASCSTIKNSASVARVENKILAGAVADLEVSSQRIVYTYLPTNAVRRGGYHNCINTAVREALEKNGGGDVLVQLETTVKVSMSQKIKSVTVSGYPAKYKNIQTVSQSSLIKGLEAGR